MIIRFLKATLGLAILCIASSTAFAASNCGASFNFDPPARRKQVNELSKDERDAHFQINTYGTFRLPDGVRPNSTGPIIPEEGYSIDVYHEQGKAPKDYIHVSVSSEKILAVLLSSIRLLNAPVDFSIERQMDMQDEPSTYQFTSVPKAKLIEFLKRHEDLIINDGVLAIYVKDKKGNYIVLDNHKIFGIFSNRLADFEDVLNTHGVAQKPFMTFLSDDNHAHISLPRFPVLFNKFVSQLSRMMGRRT